MEKMFLVLPLLGLLTACDSQPKPCKKVEKWNLNVVYINCYNNHEDCAIDTESVAAYKTIDDCLKNKSTMKVIKNTQFICSTYESCD